MARETAASIRADFHPALIGPLRCGGPRISRVGKQRAKSWPACAKVGPRKSALLTARFHALESRQSESDAHHKSRPRCARQVSASGFGAADAASATLVSGLRRRGVEIASLYTRRFHGPPELAAGHRASRGANQ